MTDPHRTTHWLRPNHAARMPRRVVTLDSEAHRTFNGIREEQRFRLAVVSFDQLDEECAPTKETAWYSTEDTAELWEWIVSKTNTQHRTVLFAHQLSYDLRLTQALKHLPEHGFRVKQMAISDYGCWVFMRDGTRSIYLVDSLSHIPKSLSSVAESLSRKQFQLPDEESHNDEWYKRCHSDVQILRESILELLRLYRVHDLGDFRATGAAQSSAAFRHRFLKPKSLLIHSDNEALKAERRACWAGRAEIWRHGEVNEPLSEYDFQAAYAHIAYGSELPARLIGEFFPRDDQAVQTLNERYALLCEVDVTTEAPTLAAESDGRILWPTGSFRTWAWDAELQNAETYGAKCSVLRCYAYERKPLLREWADWIIDSLAGKELGATPLGKIVAKEWSRSLIGRFGLRYPLLDFQGTISTSDLLLQPVHDLVEDRSYMQLQIGNELYEQTERIESPNSSPQIMGYIMARSRVWLWQAMIAAGLDNVCSVDTDGLIVTEAGATNLAEYARLSAPAPLRLKGQYRHAEFRGPRNLDLDDDRRVNGVPRKAEKVRAGVYKGEVWESLPTSLRRRNPSTLLVHERIFSVSDVDPRRLHLADGQTGAHRLGDLATCADRTGTGNNAAGHLRRNAHAGRV